MENVGLPLGSDTMLVRRERCPPHDVHGCSESVAFIGDVGEGMSSFSSGVVEISSGTMSEYDNSSVDAV